MPETVTIIRASNAFLYLPLYVAESQKLFDDVQKEQRFREGRDAQIDFKFTSRRATQIGDRNAIKEMLELTDEGKIAFALGSPLQILKCGEDPAKLAVFGAIVKRPPFWIVNGQRNAEGIESLKLRNLIFYDEDTLQTGNYLGNFICDQLDLPADARLTDVQEVGRELSLLSEKKRAGASDWGALTVNLLGLARALHTKGPDQCRMVLSLSKQADFQNYVTTAFITRRSLLKNEGRAADVLLKALKRAVVFLHMTQSNVARLCRVHSAKGLFQEQLTLEHDGAKELTASEGDWIANQILVDEIYSDDLSISQDDWDKAAAFTPWSISERAEFRDLYRNSVDEFGNHLDRLTTLGMGVSLVPIPLPSEKRAADDLSTLTSLNFGRISVVGDYLRSNDKTREELRDWRGRIASGLESKTNLAENFLIWGNPGSGKSFFVQQIAKSLEGQIAYEEIDCSSIKELDLISIIAKIENNKEPSLIFFDEVDTDRGGNWLCRSIFKALERNELTDKSTVFVFAGSKPGGLKNLVKFIEHKYHDEKGPDLISRIPEEYRFIIPALTNEERTAVIASLIYAAGRKRKMELREIEKLALFYALIHPELVTPRDFKLRFNRAISRMPRNADGRFRFADLFEKYGDVQWSFLRKHPRLSYWFSAQYVHIVANS